MSDYNIAQFIDSLFTLEEKKLLQNDNNIYLNSFTTDRGKDWNDITQSFKALLPYANLDNYQLYVDLSCSSFIKELFNKNVNDDSTFVISTTNEFSFTVNCLNRIKNKKLLSYEEIKTLNITPIIEKIKASKSSSVFIYMVGTIPSTGQIVPQMFFENLINELKNINIPYKIALDDVHGMFLIPRNYSIFDYILYTTHSYIPNFNMGMMWSKTEESFGLYNEKRALDFYNKLQIYLSKIDKIRLFQVFLTEYFSSELSTKYLDLFTNTALHFFALRIKDLSIKDECVEQLAKNCVWVDKPNKQYGDISNFISFKLQDFMLEDSSYLLNSLKLCKLMLKKVLDQKNMLYHLKV